MKSNITINLSEWKYKVLTKVAKSLEWRISTRENCYNNEVVWADGGVTPEKLASLKLFQKINHFPGMLHLARKDTLASNLTKMKRIFPEEYDFFPPSWVLPADYSSFR